MESIFVALYLCFDSQLKMLRLEVERKMRTDLKKLESKPLEDICFSLSDILNSLSQQCIHSFDKRTNELILEGSEWHYHIEIQKTDLAQQLENAVYNTKEVILFKLTQ